jgi:hypothetical protein
MHVLSRKVPKEQHRKCSENQTPAKILSLHMYIISFSWLEETIIARNDPNPCLNYFIKNGNNEILTISIQILVYLQIPSRNGGPSWSYIIMVVGFTHSGFTTTCAICAYHHWRCEFESCSGEVYSIQHCVIKFVL